MNYTQSLKYLNSFLNLERITVIPNSRLWNLKRMRLLLDHFDHPEKGFFRLLIAGTKGKGSTGFFLENILKSAGYRVGFYCSPHLEDPRERIRIGGKMISREMWAWGVAQIKLKLARGCQAPGPGSGAWHLFAFTYFEILTLLAVLIFKKMKIKIGIFEVGMGGRLDATNALKPHFAILTPIHFDHEDILGHTLTKIAGEKAAIIHPHADVIVAPQFPEAMRVIHRRIQKVKARYWPSYDLKDIRVGLEGDFQQRNAGAAWKAAEVLNANYGFKISTAQIRKGLMAKDWPGRMESIQTRPLFLLDSAHNPISIQALVRNLGKSYAQRNRILLFATSRDKKSEAMLRELSHYFPKVILSRSPNPRAQEIGILMLQARKYFKQIYPAGDIEQALALVHNMAQPKDLIVATGSIYFIGEIRKRVR